MASAIIGALRVVLGADSAALEKGLKQAQGSLKGFAYDASKIAAGIGLEKIVEKAAGAFTHALKQGFEAADQLGKSSQKIGIPVDQLAKLKYAAELSDVSMQTLEKGVGKLSITMAQSFGGAVNESTRALANLGIKVKDSVTGEMKPATEVIAQLAAKFEGIGTTTGKAALAMQIFGSRIGKEMIPLLNSGSEGLKKMYEEAEKLGLVFTKETIAAATQFNDDMKTLSKISVGVAYQITAALAPAFGLLAEKIKTAVLQGDLVSVLSQGIISLFSSAYGMTIRLAAGFIRLAQEAQGLMMIFKGLGEWSDGGAEMVAEGWKKIVLAGKNFHNLVGNLDADVKKFLDEAAARAKKLGEEWGKGTKTAASGVQAHSDELQKFIEGVQKSTAAQEAEFRATDMAAGAKERLKIVMQGLEIALTKNIPLNEANRAKLTETANAAELVALKLGNLKLINDSNPFVTLQTAIDTTNIKLADAGLKIEDHTILTQQAAKLQQKSWETAATSLGSSFESIGSSLASLNEGWARAAKIGQAISAVVAFVNAYVAASEAFAKTAFPLNIAIAAGVLAKGIAMAAAIKGAVIPKAAEGGSFMVQGGMSGIDNRLVQMNLAAGERVDVTPASEAGGGNQTITVNGINPRDYYRGDVLRDLVSNLNEAIGDGLRIRMAPA